LTICWPVKAAAAALTFPVPSQWYSCNTPTAIVERTGEAGPFSLTIRDSRKNLSIERPTRFIPMPFSIGRKQEER